MSETIFPDPAPTVELAEHRGHKTALRVAAVAGVLVATAAAAFVTGLIHLPQRSTAQVAHDPTHLAFGQAYETRTGISITLSPPVDDGNGHTVVYANEANEGHHAYLLYNQFFTLGGKIDAPGIPNATLYPTEQVTYKLVFDGVAPGPVTYHPAPGNQHNTDVVWAAN